MTDLSGISDSLRRGEEGIWTVARTVKDRPISFPVDGHAECLQIEESSFWFHHRNACLLELLRQFPPAGTVFELGSGNGFVASAFEKAGYATAALEPGIEGARNAKRRGIGTVISSTLQSANFRDGSLPAIGLFDVIEHIEHDGPFLDEVVRVLAPGGRLYVTVPAYRALWSDEDVVAGHFRRYSLRRIQIDLARGGLSIEYASYLFAPLIPLVFLFRTIPSYLGRESSGAQTSRAAKQHVPRKTFLTRLLTRALGFELARLRAGGRVAFGTSCLVVARKAV